MFGSLSSLSILLLSRFSQKVIDDILVNASIWLDTRNSQFDFEETQNAVPPLIYVAMSSAKTTEVI